MATSSNLTSRRIGGLGLLPLCIVYVWLIGDIAVPMERADQFNARSLPTLIGYAAIFMCVWLVVTPQPQQPSPAAEAPLDWWRLAQFVVLLGAYSYAIERLGFIFPSIIFLWVGAVILGAPHKILAGVIATLVTVALWLLLSLGLDMHLPGVGPG